MGTKHFWYEKRTRSGGRLTHGIRRYDLSGPSCSSVLPSHPPMYIDSKYLGPNQTAAEYPYRSGEVPEL